MQKLKFSEGEGLSIFWLAENDELIPHHCVVSEIEDTGIWVTYDDEPDKEEFRSFEDMKMFVRDGSNVKEGNSNL